MSLVAQVIQMVQAFKTEHEGMLGRGAGRLLGVGALHELHNCPLEQQYKDENDLLVMSRSSVER